MSKSTPSYLPSEPLKISEMVGLEDFHTYLINTIDDPVHTPRILIFGQYGTGKSSLAKAILLRANCLNPQGVDACHECESCRAWINCPDFIPMIPGSYLDGATDSRNVLINLRANVFYGNRSMLWIDDLEKANKLLMARLQYLLDSHPETLIVITSSDNSLVEGSILSRMTKIPLTYSEEDLALLIKRECCKKGVQIESERHVEVCIKYSGYNPRGIVKGIQDIAHCGLKLDDRGLSHPIVSESLKHYMRSK